MSNLEETLDERIEEFEGAFDAQLSRERLEGGTDRLTVEATGVIDGEDCRVFFVATPSAVRAEIYEDTPDRTVEYDGGWDGDRS